MLSRLITQAAVRALDFLAKYLLPAKPLAEHTRIGRRGEEDAYFHLRKLGYIVVVRNFRVSRRPGEIDLIAWHKDILCFIEVKTRTTHDVKPAQTAVDPRKWRQLNQMAREYLRTLSGNSTRNTSGGRNSFSSALQSSASAPRTSGPLWRFDVICVYYEAHSRRPRFELFENALPAA